MVCYDAYLMSFQLLMSLTNRHAMHCPVYALYGDMFGCDLYHRYSSRGQCHDDVGVCW